MVILGITKRPEYGEYRVYWNQDGKDMEAPAYYTEDAQDAVNTMLAMYEDIRKRKVQRIKISDSKYTRKLLEKYAPEEFLALEVLIREQAQV